MNRLTRSIRERLFGYDDASSISQLAAAKEIAITGSIIALVTLIQTPEKGHTRLVALVRILVAVLSRIWARVASHFVPEPYLDEVFHIPQVQKYCEGRYDYWDDKITTPPGLYLFSRLILKIEYIAKLAGANGCDTASLRVTNTFALNILAVLATLARKRIEARLHEGHAGQLPLPTSQYAAHTALNVALCPIVFFFSGLYYTDVASTAVVLACFVLSLDRMGKERAPLWSDFATILLGLLALLMRQTNVFWVVVFLGCLEGIHAVRALRPERVDQPALNTLGEQVRFFAWRWSVGDIHDLPMHMSWTDDWICTILSILVAAVCNLPHVLRQVWPHVTVLLSFVGFVAWNGGVVLGDKSNHVATIHLAQMLYIWPLFAFFSLPLLLPYALPFFSALSRILTNRRSASTKPATDTPSSNRLAFGSGSSRKGSTKKPSNGNSSQASSSQTLPKRTGFRRLQPGLIWPAYILLTLVLSFLVVKYNTIIHPFTLADNRHYMFYVFRYTIRRSTALRFALILPYTLSRWLVWGTLTGCSDWAFEITGDDCSRHYTRVKGAPFVSSPVRTLSDARQTDAPYPPVLKDTVPQFENPEQNPLCADALACSVEPISTSTGIVFLLATTLSLITAPLVEPRYFIIPWVIWRLMVPAWRLHDHGDLFRNLRFADTNGRFSFIYRMFKHCDLRLILETLWFIAINLVTMYIFIAKPYQWSAEDGTLLDDGRLQRFMW